MNSEKPTLEGMKEWVDFDQALFGIGRELGVFAKEYQHIPNIKTILWSRNPVNDCLASIAGELVRIGYLEYDRERLRYRLKEGFNLIESCERNG